MKLLGIILKMLENSKNSMQEELKNTANTYAHTDLTEKQAEVNAITNLLAIWQV